MQTFQGMRWNTEYIAEKIRSDAIAETFEKWKNAVKNYYSIGYDSGESVKLYKELEKLGADMNRIVEIDLALRDNICYGEEIDKELRPYV